jgi:hypothetical protein
MEATKPLRKKPLVGPRIKSRTFNSFEVDDTNFTGLHYISKECEFRFYKTFTKPDKNDCTKQAGVVITLSNNKKTQLTSSNLTEHANIMEIACVNGKYCEGDFEEGKCIIRSTVTKKLNPLLFDSILADLIKIKDTVIEQPYDNDPNILIGDPTKRVRIDVVAECEYMRKSDEDHTFSDILTSLKFQTFVEDI